MVQNKIKLINRVYLQYRQFLENATEYFMESIEDIAGSHELLTLQTHIPTLEASSSSKLTKKTIQKPKNKTQRNKRNREWHRELTRFLNDIIPPTPY